MKNILEYKSLKVEADRVKISEVLTKELLKFNFETDYLKEGVLQIDNASEITFYSCVIENYTETRSISESNRPNRSGVPQSSKRMSEFNVWDYKLSFDQEFRNSTDNHDILESHHAIGCGTCKQHGKIRCSSCRGSGDITCSSCSGRGEKQCDNCNGRVNIKCWSCSGKGTKETGYGENKRIERCSSCSGRGSNKCTRCSNGFITCSTCSGSGKVTCYTCHGSGEITCYQCEGYKTMDHFFIVSARYINLSQTLYLTNPYTGFDQNKSKTTNFNIQRKLFDIKELKFKDNHLNDIKTSPFYRQIASFFDFTNNELTKLIASRITCFENKYFEVTFSFYGEKYTLFLDKNFENSYYNGKKPSDQYELALLKKSIDSAVKNKLSVTKKTIQKLSKYDFISISEKEIINAIEDTEYIYEAHNEYKNKKYSSSESALRLVSNTKKDENDFILIRKKLNRVYKLNTLIFWLGSLPLLYCFLIDTSFYWISINICVALIILILSLNINKRIKNITYSRLIVVFFIIIQIISINIIYPSSSRKIACDCYNQSVLKSGRAYDDMSRNEQIFREKCFQEFRTEEDMKRASIFFPKKSEPSVSVPTIKIGQQEWMADEINTSVYNNGDPINEAQREKQWKDYGNKKIGCYRKLSNGTYVYNAFAVNDNRGIIPSGFILPTFDQFNQLFKFLGGGDSQTGKATKSMATYPIYIEDWVGDQETGGLEEVEIKTNGNSKFNAKKGGFIYDLGTPSEGNCSYWWTASTEGTNMIVVDIGWCSQDLGGGKGAYPKSFGFAVRGLKK